MDRYSNCGIPYRRGYLLYGPPGTGKSSLSFAIAGVFGVDIYCISMNDPGLSDGELLRLLSHLPRHCVLLLEDIDGANIQQRNDDNDDRRSTHDGRNKSGVSLSGLLNAIDGVASPEGRILIVTTNFPERLDAALIRPGRIDRKVEFKLASKEVSYEMFLRLYSNHEGNAEAFDLKSLATKFMEDIPSDLFTPAELQGFFLARTDARDAVKETGAFVEAKRTKEMGKSPNDRGQIE